MFLIQMLDIHKYFDPGLFIDINDCSLITKFKGHEFEYSSGLINYNDQFSIPISSINLFLSKKSHKTMCDFMVFILDCYYRAVNNSGGDYLYKLDLMSKASIHISKMDGYGCTATYKDYFIKHRPQWKI